MSRNAWSMRRAIRLSLPLFQPWQAAASARYPPECARNVRNRPRRLRSGDGAAWCDPAIAPLGDSRARSEEHTSELQSLMRISYAVFCLKKKRLNSQSVTIAQDRHTDTLARSQSNKSQNHTIKT